jgi:hypothetical protein
MGMMLGIFGTYTQYYVWGEAQGCDISCTAAYGLILAPHSVFLPY